jgi:hypothetical protein
MSGAPSEATICARERRYFFTSRSHRMYTMLMGRSALPRPDDLSHLIGRRGALIPDLVPVSARNASSSEAVRVRSRSSADEPIATIRP